MSRPICPEHPDGKVWRDGHYGTANQYQRWRCVPKNGDQTHRFRPTLPPRATNDTGCMECGRHWRPGEGMLTAVGDRFSLREKAAALIRLSEGESYRSAGAGIRGRANFLRPGPSGEFQPSPDGRLTRDWVSHYTDLLADEYLPEAWPEVLVLDHVPFHVKAKRPDGRPLQSGRLTFVVLAALSYGTGTVRDAGAVGRRPLLWRLRAEDGAGRVQWTRLLQSLPGRPRYVVCDRHRSLILAIRAVWPGMKIYPCAYHLGENLSGLIRKGGLWGTGLERMSHAGTFSTPKFYGALLDVIEALKNGDYKLDKKQQCGIAKIEDWLASINDDVVRSLGEHHAPFSTGGLEQPLRAIKNHLYDRRAVLKNLDRLDDLLTLFQMNQRGVANERAWAEVLRGAHLEGEGRIFGRREVDISRRRAR
jgi:hypothetical protein